MSGTTDLEGNHTDESLDPMVEHNFLIDEIDLWLAGILKKAGQEAPEESNQEVIGPSLISSFK